MSASKVLYICQEITPYLPESEMSTICRQLPQHIQERGCEIRTFMPRYASVNERRNQLHEVQRLSGMNLIIDDNDHPLIIKVASIQSARMQVYFIDNDDFFHHKFTVADANGNEPEDNAERSIFFVRGVLETVRKMRWVPDVIHCHGWFSALAMLYLKKTFADDPFFKNAKLVYSIYDDAFKQSFPAKVADQILAEGVTPDDFTELLPAADYPSLMRLAARYADALVQASANVHPEVENIVKESGKPFMVGSSDDHYANYHELYQSLLEQK
ncbi:MAG: glycogen/starch synthase [Bacteroidales bacterium]|nr:glycogen/starch synthase [Bacteroidales bacterium]